jgi:hypothetical protein
LFGRCTGRARRFSWAISQLAEKDGVCIPQFGIDNTKQTIYSPSAFVISDEGEVAQKQIWKETIALFKKEAPKADISSFDN